MASLVLVAFALLAVQAPAAARHNFSMLEVDRQEVAAGEEVTVSGFSYTDTAAVRFGSLEGPLLGELDPTENDDIEGTLRIPADAAPGRYILYAFEQDAAGEPARFPGQAAVVVAEAGGAPLDLTTGLEVEPRPTGLLMQESATPGELIGVALAAVVAVLLISMLAAKILSPRAGPHAGGRG